VLLWGPTWLGLDLPGHPFGGASVVRMFGAVGLCAGYCAAGFSTVDDARARRRCLAWFIGAHVIVLLALLTQRIAIWGPGPADYALWLVLGCSVMLATAEYQYPVVAFMRLLGVSAESPADRLRTAHERRIREAAGQEERNRLARDLHDAIKQQIFAIQTAAATAQVRFDTDAVGARQALEQIRAAARDAMTEMEVMLDQLRAVPLSNAGLVAALRKQCEAVGFQTGAHVEFKLGALPPDEALAPGTQQAMLRVAQEALANVARHARATLVKVSLDAAAGRVELVVQDDGAGIVPGHRSGTGMANMAQRATEIGGSLSVSSRPADQVPDAAGQGSAELPASGTLVSFSVPWNAEAQNRQIAWVTFWSVLLACSIAGLHSCFAFAAVTAAVAAIGLTWSIVRHRRMGTTFSGGR
jgi:signal transduction histidine kinase